MAAQADRGVPLSTLCPKFLHTNSTSHTWPFSAIAELIDNAYDPDVSANHFWIDKTVFQEQDCLIFMDSGNGLDIETMHKMLSFGYSDKTALKGVKPIGMYGNGFKSGAMRLGKDAIVFSKSKTTSCVGMLSQTYLKEIDAKQIVVPIVCFEEIQTNKFSVREEQQASLNDILTYSPFKTQDELLKEIKTISSSFFDSKTGTRIIIWNLRRTPTRTSEFEFQTDRYDIRIPSDVYEEMNESGQQLGRLPSHIPESSYSLRAYCSILYLKPRMQIIIRGQKVKSQLIQKSLAFVRKDVYKPTFLNNKPIHITFGYNTKSKDQYGVMMYHKNRLIKAYERVGCQLKANNKGVGVIGVIECGKFLEPTHNKQSFNETDQYRKTMTNLGIKLEEYWQEMRYRRQTEDPNNSIPLEDTTKRPDQNWAQCDKCLNWRKLPDGIDPSKLPDKWFCHLNPDPAYRSCEVPEEREDSDDDQPAYRKTYKQQERVLKQKEEMKRKTAEQQKLAQLKRREDNCLAELAKQNQALKRQLQIRERIANSPSNNTNAKSANIASPQGGAATAKSSLLRTSTVSQAACSSAGSSGLPVISSVCSLSTTILGQKRTQLTPPQTTPKRPRFSGLHTGPSNTSTSEDVGPQSSPSVSLNGDDDDEDDETDDDIFILETSSTPKPKKPELDLTKVKTEQVQSDVDVLLECSDDAALDVSMETNDAAANAVGASPFPVHASSTTQTEVTKLKKEDESPSVSEGEERAVQSTADLKDKEKCEDEDVGVYRTKTDCMDDEVAGPSCSGAYDKNPSVTTYPGMVEVQKQQDQLLELMQSTAEERDSLKDEVHRLTCELHDMQSKLQELTQINVKKECSHQASQTEETGEGGCYKSLFEKAKQKVDELIKDKEGLLLATESKPSTSKEEEKDMDEIALQVDSLLRELDERNNERDELRTQLDHLEEERANMASQCEELRLSLQQQKEDRGASHGTTNSSVRTHPEDNGGTSSGPDASKSSLIELRHNIGRLLVSIVPALDLGQVNYECNVIDEILEQVLCNPGTTEPVELNFRSKSINTSS